MCAQTFVKNSSHINVLSKKFGHNEKLISFIYETDFLILTYVGFVICLLTTLLLYYILDIIQ